MRQHARLVKPVKIKMVDLETLGLVNFAEGKARTGYFVLAAGTLGETAHKGCLATTQIADQLDNFTAL